MIKKINFKEIFKANADGTMSPLRKVQIGGVILTPGVTSGTLVSFGGVTLKDLINKDLAIEKNEYQDLVIIKGYYK